MLYEVVHTLVPPVAKALWRPGVTGAGARAGHRPGDPGEQPPAASSTASSSRSWCRARSSSSPSPTTSTAPASRARSAGSGSRASACCRSTATTPRRRIASLDTALEVLGRGEAFGIYPEGTRSRDGRLYRGRTGVAHLALTAGCPVVPVGLTGTQDIQPVGAKRPRLAKVVGRRSASRSTSPGGTTACPLGRARREVTDEIMAAIAGLSGQEPAGRLQRATRRRLSALTRCTTCQRAVVRSAGCAVARAVATPLESTP